MKKALLILTGLWLAFGSMSQTLDQQVIATAGNYSEAGGISLSWTMGECVIATFGNNDIILTQGFQQPLMTFTGQLLHIPEGWSGISSWVDPTVPLAEDIFEPVVANLVILLNPLGQVFWPAQGINQIDPPPAEEPGWVPHHGYIVKMDQEALILVEGLAESDLSVNLPAGWYTIPILAQNTVPSSSLFGQLDPNLVIVKEIAGNRIWWPAMGVLSLTSIEPGKSYQILLTATDVLDYTAFNAPAPVVPSNIELNQLANNTPWNDVIFTGTSHTIAIDESAWDHLAGTGYGDYLGVFDQSGLCSGMIMYSGKREPLSITAFGDDLTTSVTTEGFIQNEYMSFRLYRPSTQEEFVITATFDPDLPDTDRYQINGLSKITDMMMMATDIGENGLGDVEIYPNPACDRVMIKCIGHISGDAVLSLYSMGSGKLIREVKPEKNMTELDISGLAQGVYFIRITDGQDVIIRKLVKQSNRIND
ncbi:MAG TPA: T9SS type A sorting domain-containing protein [Bacteroidales bacterium]|nr:T9SS type A sorting domain-containing protein [Bacteroidales bacterium]HRZ20398.1 T9SS type A sorting domain-containing protein [Bacteroidales bacterium]